MKKSPHPDDPVRMSFVAMFRAAPPGETIFLMQSAHWCTSVAAQSGRKISTRKTLALDKRKETVSEITMVSFLDERGSTRKGKVARSDPRQFLIPGLGSSA